MTDGIIQKTFKIHRKRLHHLADMEQLDKLQKELIEKIKQYQRCQSWYYADEIPIHLLIGDSQE